MGVYSTATNLGGNWNLTTIEGTSSINFLKKIGGGWVMGADNKIFYSNSLRQEWTESSFNRNPKDCEIKQQEIFLGLINNN